MIFAAVSLLLLAIAAAEKPRLQFSPEGTFKILQVNDGSTASP